MPRFGLALTKRAVNQCEDAMGMRTGMDSVFGLHHFAHAHNAEVGADSLGGMDAQVDEAAGSYVDLDLDDAHPRLPRRGARVGLREHVPDPPLPSMDTAEGFEAHREWEHTLADARLSVVSWPAELGGRDASLLQWVVFEEEYFAAQRAAAGEPERHLPARADAVRPRHAGAAGPDHAADGARRRDLGAGLVGARGRQRPGRPAQPRAVRTDGGWLLSGQKTWSTRATYADRGFGLFRTDPDAERHRGLTYFLFDLRADGVTVRGIPQLDGEPGFAEIFLDDVFVPDATCSAGSATGWRVAMSTASNERGLSLRSPGRFLAAADRLVDAVARRGCGDTAPDRPGRCDAWIGARAYQLHTWATVTRLADGGELGAESSVGKLFWSQLDVALHETALELLGADGELVDEWMARLPVLAGRADLRRHERDPAQRRGRAAAGAAAMRFHRRRAARLRRVAGELLAAADVPAVARAWGAGDAAPGRKLWSRLAELGVSPSACPSSTAASAPHRSIWCSRSSSWWGRQCPARSSSRSRCCRSLGRPDEARDGHDRRAAGGAVRTRCGCLRCGLPASRARCSRPPR